MKSNKHKLNIAFFFVLALKERLKEKDMSTQKYISS